LLIVVHLSNRVIRLQLNWTIYDDIDVNLLICVTSYNIPFLLTLMSARPKRIRWNAVTNAPL